MTDTKPIELRLLGELEIRGPGLEVGHDLTGQIKCLALLSYLALSPGLHRRESLLPLFWPERDPTSGRRALRQSIYRIRQGFDREVFQCRRDELGVDMAALWCDATALEEAHDAGEDEMVVRLFRGELLPGFHLDDATPEFERHLEDARERVRDKGLRSMRRLASRRLEDGVVVEAGELGRRALEIDPHDESSLRILIEALERGGDRAAALRAYEIFAERLDREFGLEPSEETRELVRRVRRPAEPNGRNAAASLPDTLPTPLTSFVGREEEVEFTLARLERPGVRLLTLTGPGGVGKSRLAIEVARRAAPRYPDGIAYVSLDAYEDPAAAVAAFARAVDVETRDHRALVSALRERLGGLRALLVLDGLDRVRETVGTVAEVLAHAPGVDALVTSRTPLEHTAEHRVPVPPLSLPEPGRRLGTDLPLDSEAVALFLERARAVEPRFSISQENVESLGSICRRLDGLPLAIELAARRLRHLPVHEIERRIDGDPALLHDDARDRATRHETLEATIRWTSERLVEDERALFVGLGTFAGDFGLETIESMWRDLGISERGVVDVLGGLIDTGLVEPVDANEARYRLLRIIRDHAAHALEADDLRDRWLSAQIRWYVRWTREGFANWCGPREREWLAALDREMVNLDVVLDRAVERDPARAAEIAASISHRWWVRGAAAEGRRRIDRLLESDAIDPSLRARLLVSLGQLASLQGDEQDAVDKMFEAVETYREIGHRRRLGWALQSVGNVLLCAGRFEEAREALEEALALGEATGNDLRVAICRREIAKAAFLEGELDRAEKLFDEALATARRERRIADEGTCLVYLAMIALEKGDPPLAASRAREALEIAETAGDANKTAHAHRALADAFHAGGLSSPEEVRRHYARALEIYAEAGIEEGICIVLATLAEVAIGEGNVDRGVRLLAGIAGFVADEDLTGSALSRRLERAVSEATARVGADAIERARATQRGVPLERLLRWAREVVPTVEIRLAAP